MWITEGETIEISGRRLNRGCFYLGSPFYIQASECNEECHFMQGEEILVPTVELETEIQQSTTFGPLSSFHAYQDLTPTHRYEFIRFLEGNFTPVKSSQAIIEYYLRGIAIRLFIDKSTTPAEKSQIFRHLLSFYSSCRKYRNLIEPVLRCAFLRLFVKDNGDIIFEDKELASVFLKTFPYPYDVIYLVFPEQEYSIRGVDSAQNPVTISIPDPISAKGQKFKDTLYNSHINLKDEQEKLKEKEAESERLSLFNKHNGCAGAHLLFGSSTEEDQSVKLVHAFYMRIINENPYVMTSYEEIIRSFGFQCKAADLGSKKHADVILGKLTEWGLTTYPNLNDIDLKSSPKFKCILYKDVLNEEIDNGLRYKTLLTYIKMALYVVQEDEYNNDDISHIKSIISRYAPNERTKKELISILLLSLNDIQRLEYLKHGIKNIEKHLIAELADTLKMLAYVDGDVTRERKEQLECLLPVLGCSIQNLDHELRQLKPKVATNKKKPLPVKISLDLSELDRLKKDTAEAQLLLNEIFAEETPAAPANVYEPPFLSALRIILTKPCWTISDVQEVCRQNGIMYGAFIENSNEYSYSIVDDILLEEEEGMIYVATNYKDDILS